MNMDSATTMNITHSLTIVNTTDSIPNCTHYTIPTTQKVVVSFPYQEAV